MAINYSICFPYCLSLLISSALGRWAVTSGWERVLQRNAAAATAEPSTPEEPGWQRGKREPFPWDTRLKMSLSAVSHTAERGSGDGPFWSALQGERGEKQQGEESSQCCAFAKNSPHFFISRCPLGTSPSLTNESSHNLIKQELLHHQVTLVEADLQRWREELGGGGVGTGLLPSPCQPSAPSHPR